MKTITLQPWQIAALQAGRLKSVWVPLEVHDNDPRLTAALDNSEPPQWWLWRGDDEGAEPWERLRLPYAVGDVVELLSGATFGFPSRYECKCSCHKAYSLPVEHKIPCCYDPVGYARIAAVSVRQVESITEQESRDAGLQDGLDAFYCQPTAGQWAVKVDLEAAT